MHMLLALSPHQQHHHRWNKHQGLPCWQHRWRSPWPARQRPWQSRRPGQQHPWPCLTHHRLRPWPCRTARWGRAAGSGRGLHSVPAAEAGAQLGPLHAGLTPHESSVSGSNARQILCARLEWLTGCCRARRMHDVWSPLLQSEICSGHTTPEQIAARAVTQCSQGLNSTACT